MRRLRDGAAVVVLAAQLHAGSALAAGPGPAATPAADAGPASAQPTALAARFSCMRCHDAVIRQVGPGFAQIVARYRDDPEAPQRLARRIRDGSVGQWGRLIMPRPVGMTEAESLVLARWVLAHRPPT